MHWRMLSYLPVLRVKILRRTNDVWRVYATGFAAPGVEKDNLFECRPRATTIVHLSRRNGEPAVVNSRVDDEFLERMTVHLDLR